jgi:hypothetical protein
MKLEISCRPTPGTPRPLPRGAECVEFELLGESGLVGSLTNEARWDVAHALTHGVTGPLGDELTRLTLTVVAASIILHGVSVTPLMTIYGRMRGRRVGA